MPQHPTVKSKELETTESDCDETETRERGRISDPGRGPPAGRLWHVWHRNIVQVVTVATSTDP